MSAREHVAGLACGGGKHGGHEKERKHVDLAGAS